MMFRRWRRPGDGWHDQLQHYVQSPVNIPGEDGLKRLEKQMKYTLDTDFSALNGPKVANWLRNFGDMTETAFADSDNYTRLLGNLLVIELCIHTLRQGLEAKGQPFPTVTQRGLDLLWDSLAKQAELDTFQDFANNLYACVLEYAVGEKLTDTQTMFYREYLGDTKRYAYEWTIHEWMAVLSMEWTAIRGGRLDFELFETCKQVDFSGIIDMLNLLPDSCIDLTGISRPAISWAKDCHKAEEQVYQTPLFQQLVAQIQGALKAALTATPEQYRPLREEWQKRGILPDEYALDLIQF